MKSANRRVVMQKTRIVATLLLMVFGLLNGGCDHPCFNLFSYAQGKCIDPLPPVVPEQLPYGDLQNVPTVSFAVTEDVSTRFIPDLPDLADVDYTFEVLFLPVTGALTNLDNSAVTTVVTDSTLLEVTSVTYLSAPDYNGRDWFWIRLWAEGVSSPAVYVDVDVFPADDAPRPMAITISTNEDSVTSVNTLSYVLEVDDEITTVTALDSTGTLGAVTRDALSNIYYNPNSAFETLQVGETAADSFRYTVQDINGNQATATVEVLITGVNDAPVFLGNAGSVNCPLGTNMNGNLVFVDIEGDPITYGVHESCGMNLTFTGSAFSGACAPIATTCGLVIKAFDSRDTGYVTQTVNRNAVRFVGTTALGLEDSSSWANVTNSIQDAVNVLAPYGGGEVWVARGTYTAAMGMPLVTMATGVSIIGSFAGIEPLRVNRSVDVTLATWFAGNGTNVIDAASGELSGLRITSGTAPDYGGAIRIASGKVTLSNSYVADNTAAIHGGAIWVGPSASLSVTLSSIVNNSSPGRGGAIYAQGDTKVYYSQFLTNSSSLGGAIYVDGAAVVVTNSTFAFNNASGAAGGAFYGRATDTTSTVDFNVQSSSFYDNSTAGPGRLIGLEGPSVGTANFAGDHLVSWNNTLGTEIFTVNGSVSLNRSCTKTLLGGSNVPISTNPFVIAASGELFLDQSGSCIDKGDNNAADISYVGTSWQKDTTSIKGTPESASTPATVDAGIHHNVNSAWIVAFSVTSTTPHVVSWLVSPGAQNCMVRDGSLDYAIPATALPSGSFSGNYASGTTITIHCADDIRGFSVSVSDTAP